MTTRALAFVFFESEKGIESCSLTRTYTVKCIQFLCANHTAIGCGCTTCHYFNGAELRDVDIKRFAPLVIDDPYQEATDEQRENVKKWFDETMSNRFNHQHDRLIIVSVPHKEDRLGSQT